MADLFVDYLAPALVFRKSITVVQNAVLSHTWSHTMVLVGVQEN